MISTPASASNGFVFQNVNRTVQMPAEGFADLLKDADMLIFDRSTLNRHFAIKAALTSLLPLLDELKLKISLPKAWYHEQTEEMNDPSATTSFLYYQNSGMELIKSMLAAGRIVPFGAENASSADTILSCCLQNRGKKRITVFTQNYKMFHDISLLNQLTTPGNNVEVRRLNDDGCPECFTPNKPPVPAHNETVPQNAIFRTMRL